MILRDKLNIGIVEDEVLIAENISTHLEDMGHHIVGVAQSFMEAMVLIKKSPPDIFLIDIRLRGDRNGLEIARELYEQYKIPFMFLTSNTDRATITQAMEYAPIAYIRKPFSYEDLFIAFELAKVKINLSNSNSRKIEIKNGTEIEWIQSNSVLYLEAARSYVTIYLTDRSIVLRQPMGTLLELFEKDEMVRIHRSYAINPKKVESVSNTKVIIPGKKIPIGPSHREEFLNWMRALTPG